MDFTEKQLDQIRAVFADALEEIVLPKFDTVNARLDGIDKRLDKLDDRMAAVERRLEKLEGSVADLRNNQAELIEAVQSKNIITLEKSRTLRSRIFGRAA